MLPSKNLHIYNLKSSEIAMKNCVWILLSWVSFFSAQETTLARENEIDLLRLSESISILQQHLAEEYGIHDLYIAGGSSLAFLDHIYASKPLQMRDVDLFAIANRPVDSELMHTLGAALTDSLGQVKDMRAKTRVVPHTCQENETVPTTKTGYGLFWHKGNILLDFSLFHGTKEFQNNGIFDIETVTIRLKSTETLQSLAYSLAQSSYASKKKQGVILDPYSGYLAWNQHYGKIVHWYALEAFPIEDALRAVRIFHKKYNGGVSNWDPERIKSLHRNQSTLHLEKYFKYLFKILGDRDWIAEVVDVYRLDLFSLFSRKLATELAQLDANHHLTAKLKNRCGDQILPLQRFLCLIRPLPDGEKQRLESLYKTFNSRIIEVF